MIEEIIALLRIETNLKFYFDARSKTGDCVVYKYCKTEDDGIKQRYRLELHIIVEGISENAILRAEEMQKKIRETILTTADRRLTKRIRKVVQNGGGNLTDEGTKTTHLILYYDVLYL